MYGVLHVSRDININLTDVDLKYDWLAKQLGQNIVTGAGVGYAMPKWYTSTDNAGSKEVSLDETPTNVTTIALYDDKGMKLVPTTDFTLTGKVVKVTKTGVTGEVEVRTFKFTRRLDALELE